MAGNMETIKARIQENILLLVNKDKLPEAQHLFNEYAKLVDNDIEVFSIQCVLHIKAGNIESAQKAVQQGLAMDKHDFDLLYNLAYIYEQKKEYVKAAKLYLQLSNGEYSEEKRQVAQGSWEHLRARYREVRYLTVPPKIAFFVKPGLEGFLSDITDNLADEYEIKTVIVTDFKQIDAAMQWADICWFEWCDELIGYASQLLICQEKQVLCRLHSYEAFTDYPAQVQWQYVNKVVFVAEHIRKYVLADTKTLRREQTVVIPNGIELTKYTFKPRNRGFNIAYVGYINYKKGPMLLLHVFKAIHDLDARYKLYIAGTFQDARDVLYFNQMINELQLQDCIIDTGWQNDLDSWLEDKHYILCTSILESQNISVMQAMTKGIKPLIHNFVGAKDIYPAEYIWSTIDQCIQLITNKEYNYNEYRQFIENNYSLNKQLHAVKKLINETMNHR